MNSCWNRIEVPNKSGIAVWRSGICIDSGGECCGFTRECSVAETLEVTANVQNWSVSE